MSDTHARTVSYVRETMLPESEPPVAEKGVIKWIRENLISSPLNAILTLISLYVIYWALAHVLPWAFNSVWNARSLTECREVFLVTGAVDGGGACWAVIRERILQLLYGFYPSDQYWRPNLTLVLFLVAIAPVLFSERVPRKMLWFTAVYPFLAPWLLWGGSFWVPVLVLLGLVIAYVAFVFVSRVAGNLGGIVAGILAAVIWWLVGVGMVNDALHRMVASGRMDDALAVAEATPDRLGPVLADLESQRDAIDVQVAELEGPRTEALAEIQAAVAVAAEETTAKVYADAGFDPEGDIPASTTLKEELEHQIQLASQAVTQAPEFDEQRSTILAATAELTELKDARLNLQAQITRVQDELSAQRLLVGAITDLETREARLAEIDENYSDIEAAVPRNMRNLTSTGGDVLPEDATEEEVAALDVYLDLKSERTTLQNAVDSTYETVGMVGLQPVDSRQFGGFMLALIIGLSGIILSLPLGILLALGRQSNLFIINKVSVTFIEVIRGVPLIVWLFTAQLLLNYFLPPGTNFDLLLRVIIMVTLFSAAYIAEVVRGGLAALPKGQYEAADALGLDYWKSMRLIVLPQALKISIPGIVNTFIGLFKDTTLVVFIGLADPIDFSNKIRANTDWNGIYWELFMFIGFVFFIFCYAMGRYSLYLERKLQREHR